MASSVPRKFSGRKDARAFAAVTLGALVIRLAFVLAVRPVPVSDFAWYYDRAIGIAGGAGFTLQGHPTALWPLGWPYFLAGVVWLFGPSVLAGEIVQAILNALTAGVVFLIGRSLFNRACGVAAGAAYALLPSAVEWCATLASEPLYTLLWALSTYIWVSRPFDRLGAFAISGALLGAAALVRPSALLFWLILLAYAFAVRSERKHLRKAIAAVGVTALCTALVVTPAIVRNYHVFGTLVIISNNGGLSLYEGNNAHSSAGYTELDNPQIQKLAGDPRTEAQGDRLASRLAIEYIKTHPGRELLLSLRKIKALYEGDDSVIRFTLRSRHFREAQSPPPSDRIATALVALNTAGYYIIMVFALAGLALCLFKPDDTINPRWRILLGLILYNTAIFAVIGGLDRYRYPTMPFFCAFAGYAMVAAYAYYQSRATESSTSAKSDAQRNPL